MFAGCHGYRDLLGNESMDSCKLDIKMKPDGSLHVPGLNWVNVHSVEEVNKVRVTINLTSNHIYNFRLVTQNG